ncbi:MAG: hypothetical protein O9294_18995 [Cytophagales bacterium]|jgi:hypothetical protein|nr:hypothetical protein [Cytophagales bacterium]
MRKFILLTLFLSSLGFTLNAQNLMDVIDPSFRNTNLLKTNENSINLNPYLFKDFMVAEIELLNDKKITIPNINLDIYNNLVVAKQSENQIDALDLKQIKSIFILQKPDVLYTIVDKQIAEENFSIDKIKLYCIYSKQLIRGEKNNSYASSEDRLVTSKKYLLIIEDEKHNISNEKQLFELLKSKDKLKNIDKMPKFKSNLSDKTMGKMIELLKMLSIN